jgi:plasmid stabilization system protein ParE
MRWGNQRIALIDGRFAYCAALTANPRSLSVRSELHGDRSACGIGSGMLMHRGDGAAVVVARVRLPAIEVVPCRNLLAVEPDGGRLV